MGLYRFLQTLQDCLEIELKASQNQKKVLVESDYKSKNANKFQVASEPVVNIESKFRWLDDARVSQ